MTLAPGHPPLRPVVIVNPRAGGGRAGRTLTGLRAVLERSLGAVDMVVTEHPGHAATLARVAAVEGRDLVIAVGGDGTLHEVANGVMGAGRSPAIGYVGAGTGGDFRRTLALEHRLDRYVEALAGGDDRWVDVGEVRFRRKSGEPDARWFINILSAGMGGLVDHHVASTSKALGGRAAYMWASFRALLDCERARLRCAWELEGRCSEGVLDAYMLAVCNGRYFGSGMHVAPMAIPDDGRFEVVVMDAPSKVAFANFSRQIYRGRHLGTPGVTHFKCDRLVLDVERATAREVFLLDADGEPIGCLPIEVTMRPRALRVRVPRGGADGQSSAPSPDRH